MYQIGADDAYFDRPVRVNGTACAGGESTTECSDVDFMPGERADIIDKARQFVLNELSTASTQPRGGNIQGYLNNTLYDGRESPSIEGEFPKGGISEQMMRPYRVVNHR
ncbi:hypothetical protein [Streptomyces sp. NPDC001340]